MKKILVILLLGLGFLSEVNAQVPWSVSGVKTRFTKGLGIPVADTTSGGAADTSHMVIRPQDGTLYYKRLGAWQAASSSMFYVPYSGATTNVDLGVYRLTSRSLKADSIYANGSGGAVAVTNSGTRSFSWGAGGSSEVTFYGFAGYDANRASSYTARSFTDKNYVDSSAALRVRYTDTSAMLSPYLRRTDSTGLLSQVVRTFGTQTIGGNKTFTNDIFASTARIGIGAGGNTSNAVLGYNVFTANTTGTKNTAMGENSLSSNVSATDNTAFGWYSLDATTGSGNTGIGSGALGTNTSGSNNTALGFGAGEYITGTNPNTTGTNSIYIGFNTKAAANGETNQTVIGHNLTGNGSNTVTIGNSSVTDNYFTGNIRGGAFIKSGGTSSQFLKADGSVDGTSYATAASISGTTNYIPKFTGSGSIGNSIAFESVGRITFESTNISPLLVNGTATNGGFLTIQKGGVDLGFFGSSESISASANKFDISARTGKGLALYTNASSTAAIDISTSNAVTLTGALSGTSLSMSGGGSFGNNVTIDKTDAVNDAIFTVKQSANFTAAGINITANNDGGAGYNFISSSTNGGSQHWRIDGGAAANTMVFKTNSTERGRFASDGTFLINTTTTDGTNKLIVNGGVKASGSITSDLSSGEGDGKLLLNRSGTRFGALGTSNWAIGSGGTDFAILAESGNGIRLITNGSTQALTLASTGAATFSSSVTATGFIVSSSKTLKNVYYRNKQSDGIDFVGYTWKKNLNLDKKKHLGFIAEEVEKVMPDAVSANEKGVKAVNYTEVLIYKLEKLTDRISELEDEIKKLKRKRK